MDYKASFHPIPLEESSRAVTTFSSNKASYKITKLRFGLKISPNSFQRIMRMEFPGLTPEIAFLYYMDDLIVVVCSVQYHLQNLKKTFQACSSIQITQIFAKKLLSWATKSLWKDDTNYELIIISSIQHPRKSEAAKRFRSAKGRFKTKGLV